MKRVDVHFRGWGQTWLLGTLANNDVDTVFEYSPQALAKGIELSPLGLPLRPGAFSAFPSFMARLPGLIADSLPDGWGLLLIDRVFAKGGRNLARITSLDRLCFIGDRAIGALSFTPADEVPLDPEDMSLLTLARAAAAVIEDEDTPALARLALVGGSPQGARPKALVQFDQATRRISTLETADGTPWLVKFAGQGEHKEVCAIEYAYSILARACGIDMPATELFDVSKTISAFGIERFDRMRGMRAPVQSFAGALNADFRLPSLDYRTLLRATRLFTQDEAEVRKAYLRCVFNVVFNNRDDHAKNFALRMSDRMQWKFSPGYDLTFNHGPAGQHQTAVEGEGLNPGRQDLLKLAANTGVAPAHAADVIDAVCVQATQLAVLLDEFDIRATTRKRVVNAVTHNVKRCMTS